MSTIFEKDSEVSNFNSIFSQRCEILKDKLDEFYERMLRIVTDGF